MKQEIKPYDAYNPLQRARKLIYGKDATETIASLAEEAGLKDPTLRRLIGKEGEVVTHKTLDTMNALDQACDRIEAKKNDKA